MDDTSDAQPPGPQGERTPNESGAIQARSTGLPGAPTPGFSNLAAPDPTTAAPPVAARAVAFGAVLVGGLLGGLVGYGIGDVLYPDSIWSAVGALAGAVTGAVGLGVLANLTLRAMNEWKSVSHPESVVAPGGSSDESDRDSGRAGR